MAGKPTSPPLKVAGKTLHDLRWQVVWYGLGLGLMGAFVVFVFPSYRGQLQGLQLPDALKAFIGNADYGSSRGFIGGEFFSWTPVILVVFAIMAGTSALAGEEAQGTIDLILAQPISRRRLALEKFVGITAAALLICVLVYLGWLISLPFVSIDLGLSDLILPTLNLLPIMLFFVVLSAWCGAVLPSRRTATGVAAGFAVVSYFISYLAELVNFIRPLRWVSVFYYSGGAAALTDGIAWPRLALLIVLTLIFGWLSLLAFARRDLGVHAG